jgi:hypothetical protein
LVDVCEGLSGERVFYEVIGSSLHEGEKLVGAASCVYHVAVGSLCERIEDFSCLSEFSKDFASEVSLVSDGV